MAKRRGGASVRIIGGLFRGRNLAFPDQDGLRPSLGRTRETLFNWLAPHISGMHCLDLFAGSGALGFEALSRGAASVILVDSSPAVCAALADSTAQLKLTDAQVSVKQRQAQDFLRTTTDPFDLIFLDPPFAAHALGEALQQIEQRGLLAANGLIYYEAPRDEAFDAGSLKIHRQGQAGAYRYGLLTRACTS